MRGEKNQKIIKKSEEKTRRNHYSDYIFGDIFQKSVSSDVWIMKKIFSRRDPLISLGGNPNPSTTEKEPIKVKIYIKKIFLLKTSIWKKKFAQIKVI